MRAALVVGIVVTGIIGLSLIAFGDSDERIVAQEQPSPRKLSELGYIYNCGGELLENVSPAEREEYCREWFCSDEGWLDEPDWVAKWGEPAECEGLEIKHCSVDTGERWLEPCEWER